MKKMKFRPWVIKKVYSNKDRNFFTRILKLVFDKYSILKIKINQNHRNKILIKDYDAVYYNIPKVAMTSLISAFEEASELDYCPDKIKKENLFKFAFVRNPYDRLFSCYKNKILEANKNEGNMRNPIFIGFMKYGDRFYPEMTFKKFVEEISKIPDSKAENHFKSQYKMVYDKYGKLKVDRIFRFENIEEDYKKICKIVGIKNPAKLPHKRKSSRGHYSKEYDSEMRKMVKERYQRDFELFGYKF